MSEADFNDLLDLAKSRLSFNLDLVNRCSNHLRLSLIWSGHFFDTAADSHCKILLRGSYGAAVEAISLLALGLLRPSILSLRSHYELSLQFLFYKDHPVEWRNVSIFHTQPTLPAVNKNYLKNNFLSFEDRFKELGKKRVRKHEDCYDLLSGVAHGTALNSISQATKPLDLIEGIATLSQAEDVFLSVGEFLSDVHVSCFESNWLSLPPAVRSSIETRFAPNGASSVLNM